MKRQGKQQHIAAGPKEKRQREVPFIEPERIGKIAVNRANRRPRPVHMVPVMGVGFFIGPKFNITVSRPWINGKKGTLKGEPLPNAVFSIQMGITDNLPVDRNIPGRPESYYQTGTSSPEGFRNADNHQPGYIADDTYVVR